MPINIEEALQRIEAGESQREIAAIFGVAVSTLNEHLNKPENAERSARARSISAESWLDRGLAYVLDENIDPARARIVAQECARRAAIRNPAYRESSKTELTGANGGPVAFQAVERLIVDSKAT